LDDFNATTDPDHQTAMFPTDCITCHSEGAWTPSTFDHGMTTFPLTGAHVPLDCIACHADGYVGTPTDCNACHNEDFVATTNPDHADAMFPTDCILCHNTGAWTPSFFDHSATAFPLNGSHVPLECISCHSDGYVGTPTDCFACHQVDYNETNNPEHLTAQFPTDCITCHNENDWAPSTFDHDAQYFPIFNGPHDQEWNQCIDCHINSSDYSIFSCTVCHTESDSNNNHNLDDIPDYVWESEACFSCHPDGSH
jgi:hypothetical protein